MRYIDADALLSKLPDDLPYKASVKRVLMQAQEADVVPKSEVARLIEDFQRSIRADAKVGMSAGEILLHINNMLAELKKKYIKDCTTCKHLVSCEPNISGNFDCWEGENNDNEAKGLR